MARKSGDASTASELFASMRDVHAIRTGNPDSLVSSEAELVVVGLPLNAFSLRYLFMNSVMPLGRFIHVYGQSGSFKTALMYEIFRWHLREAGGGAIYLLTESRDQPDWRLSIVGHENGKSCRLETCHSLEHWQERLIYWLKYFRENHEAGDVTYPLAIGIDSLMGASCEAAIEQVWKDGHASMNFAREANLINTFTKAGVFFEVMHWPFTVIGSNHMKIGSDRYGNPVPRVAGGDALKFHSTFQIMMRFLRDVERENEDGALVAITMDKCSHGSSRNKIEVEVLWGHENGRQWTVWDWHAASILLLGSFTGSRGDKLAEIVDIELHKQQRRASSKVLGLSKVPYTEAGAALEERKDILKPLHEFFGIHERTAYRPNIAYSQQIAEAVAAGSVEPSETLVMEGGVEKDEEPEKRTRRKRSSS